MLEETTTNTPITRSRESVDYMIEGDSDWMRLDTRASATSRNLRPFTKHSDGKNLEHNISLLDDNVCPFAHEMGPTYCRRLFCALA